MNTALDKARARNRARVATEKQRKLDISYEIIANMLWDEVAAMRKEQPETFYVRVKAWRASDTVIKWKVTRGQRSPETVMPKSSACFLVLANDSDGWIKLKVRLAVSQIKI